MTGDCVYKIMASETTVQLGVETGHSDADHVMELLVFWIFSNKLVLFLLA